MKKLKLNKQTISILGNKGQKSIIGGEEISDRKSNCISGSCDTSCCPTMPIGPANSCNIQDSCKVKCVGM